jgi:hypothetical protein
MGEVVVDVRPGLYKKACKTLEDPRTKALLQDAVEQKLKALLLFQAVDDMLSKSSLNAKQAVELSEEVRARVARRHGLL